jgi:hypothetical protein
MATIWDDKNHQAGEEFVLSPKATQNIKSSFSKAKEPFEKISKAQYMLSKKKKEIIDLAPSSKKVEFFFKDKKQNVFQCILQSSDNSNFKWNSSGKSETNELTVIKEYASLEIILREINSQKLPCCSDELATIVRENFGVANAESKFREIYFDSALAHGRLAKKIFGSGSYIGERQQGTLTKPLYALAKKLNQKAADNWNPSDLWIFKTSFVSTYEKKIKEFELNLKNPLLTDEFVENELKTFLDENLSNLNLVGISLKQIDKGNGNSSLVSSENISKSVEGMDFDKTSCELRKSKDTLPAYGGLETKSGFEIKWGGRANAQLANINVEGHMVGNNFQLGAIDSNEIDKFFAKKNITRLTDSQFNEDNILDYLTKYIKILKDLDKPTYDLYIGKKGAFEILMGYSFVECKRFVANISFLQLFSSINKIETQYLYFIAKKVSPKNPTYYVFK